MFRCLCCGNFVKAPSSRPVTNADARRAATVLLALGFTVQEMLTVHRENLDFTWPGFTLWLERNADDVLMLT